MSSTLTFTQGFFLGQLTVVLLIGAFIKFFIFAPQSPSLHSSQYTAKAPSTPTKQKHNRSPSLHSLASSKYPAQPPSLRNKASHNILRPVSTTANDTASILRKTYYAIPPNNLHPGRNDHTTHQPESLDWFNVLIAQLIAEYRTTVYQLRDPSTSTPTVLTSLEAAINEPSKRPSWLSYVKITEISMGEEYPIFSNVRIIPVPASDPSDGVRLQALVDVDLSDDNLTLAIETSLILNYPQPLSAALPVALSVSVVRFSGTLSISFVPATETSTTEEAHPTSKPQTNLAFSFLPDYRLDLSVRSLIGSRSRLQDVPKIAQLIESRAQAWFEERVVEPRVQVVPLPGMWPRMGKTRVREGGEDDRPASQNQSSPPRLSMSGMDRDREWHRRRSTDNLPSQEEAEKMFEGLRWRSGFDRGHQRRRPDSQVLVDDQDYTMPGSLPT